MCASAIIDVVQWGLTIHDVYIKAGVSLVSLVCVSSASVDRAALYSVKDG